MLSQPDAAAISERYVAVRLTGGDTITPEVRGFMQRYGVRAYPTLLVMNADGHVVVDEVAPNVRGMLEALARGDEREAEFDALSQKTDDESRVRVGDMLVHRRQFEDAERVYRAIVEESPSAHLHGRIAELYRLSGQRDRERDLLTVMLGLYPEADNRIRWQLRLATIDFDVRRMRSKQEFAQRLHEARKNVEDIWKTLPDGAAPQDEAEVRAELANLLLLSGQPESAEKHARWVVDNLPRGRAAAPSLMILANVSVQRRQHAACREHLLQLLRDHPASPEARNAPRLLRRLEQIMAERDAPQPEPATPQPPKPPPPHPAPDVPPAPGPDDG